MPKEQILFLQPYKFGALLYGLKSFDDIIYSSRIKIFFASELVKRKFEFEQPIDEYNWLIKEWDFVFREIREKIYKDEIDNLTIWTKDQFIISLLNVYIMEKLGVNGFWYPSDKDKRLYNYIKDNYKSWLEKMSTISMKYNIYANLLIHPYDVRDFLDIISNNNPIPFYNPYVIGIKNIPKYIKFNRISSKVEIDILYDNIDYKEIYNWVKFFRILHYKYENDKDISDDEIKFYFNMYNKDKVDFTTKGIKRNIIGLFIYDLEKLGELHKDVNNRFIYKNIKLELKNSKIYNLIGEKEELTLNTFLNSSYKAIKQKIYSTKYEIQNNNFLERIKLSNYKCNYVDDDSLVYFLRDIVK